MLFKTLNSIIINLINFTYKVKVPNRQNPRK